LRVEKIERVDHVAGEIVRTTEAGIAIEPVVVGLERIGNDEMAAASDLHPIGELVVESVAVIEEAAGLHQKFAGVLAWPSVEPADRRTAGKLANAFDREPDVLALGCLVHVVVVDPAPAVTDDLMPFSKKRPHRLAALLHAADYTEDTDLDSELPEDAEEP